MASPSSNNNNNNNSSFQPGFPNGFDPTSIPNTTFVQADPTTFRAVVQKLTGASKPVGKPNPVEMGPRKPAFKLHERRQTARKLEIKLNNNAGSPDPNTNQFHHTSPSTVRNQRLNNHVLLNGGENNNMVMISPVSPLEYYFMEEEERAIAGKGFYLHPSPLSTPRGSDPPELLPLFPLHSPREG